MKKIIMAAAMFLGSVSASATSYIETAKSFIDALDSGHPAEIADLLADDMVFEDPTWGASQSGKATVLKAYTGYTGPNMHNLHKYVTDAFESNGVVVLTYVVHADMDLTPGAAPEDRVGLMGRIIRVVCFNKDGKIMRHTDLADYGQVQRDIAAAKAARGIK